MFTHLARGTLRTIPQPREARRSLGIGAGHQKRPSKNQKKASRGFVPNSSFGQATLMLDRIAISRLGQVAL